MQGMKNYMVTYRRSDNLEIISNSDAHYAGCVDSNNPHQVMSLH
jgi:hypothetical protein